MSGSMLLTSRLPFALTVRAPMQLSALRKTYCFPYLHRSDASLHASLALMAIETPEDTGATQIITVQTHLLKTFPALNKSLVSMDRGMSQDAALAVVLLMSVAMKLEDMPVLNSHSLGLVSLIRQYRELLFSFPGSSKYGALHSWAHEHMIDYRDTFIQHIST